ncbi:MAG: GAF domain-containing protein [Anaerolineae bacterium]
MEPLDSSLRDGFIRKLASIVVPLLIALAVVVNILAFVLALFWAERFFPGLLFYPRLVAARADYLDLNTRFAELQSGAVLTQLNGQPISTGQELYNAIHQPAIDSRVDLTFEPGARTLGVALTPFPLQELIRLFWLPFVIGLVYLGLGLVVYRLRRADATSQVFVAFCAFTAIFMGGFFDQHTLHLLTPLWVIALPLVGAALIHLSFVFPAETRLARRRPRLIFAPYLAALTLGVINLYYLYISADRAAFLWIWSQGFTFIAVSVLLFLVLLLNGQSTTFVALIRQQITIIFWGSLISFGPITVWVLAQTFGLNWSSSWFNLTTALACLLVFPIVVAYAALRHHLLDLDLVFSRAIVYTLLTLAVTAAYFVLIGFLATQLHTYGLIDNPIVSAIFILVLVIGLGPLRERLQSWVNRRLMRDAVDFRQALQQYGQELISSPLDTSSILNLLLKQIDETLQPENVLVFLKDTNLDTFTIHAQVHPQNTQPIEVSFGPGNDLVNWLTKTKDILYLPPTESLLPELNINPEELARLKMLNVTLCVPFVGAERLTGWFSLGIKKSGHPYRSNDLHFLATLASQTSIALESAHLLEQANQRTAELTTLQSVSADIQTEAEPDLLLASIIRRATHLLQAAGGLVFMLEPDNQTLKVVLSYNLGTDYTGVTLKKGEDVAGQVLLRRESVVTDYYPTFPARSSRFKEAKFGAVLGVPLIWADQIRGVLLLTHRVRSHRFSERDVWLMELFAAQAGIALEKSRLLKEATHRANQLATLSEVSVAISSTLNLDTALNRVMDCAVQILEAEAGSLLLLDRRGKELTFEVVLGPTGSELKGLKTENGKGIVGTVAKSGRPLIINNAPADSRWNIAFDEATQFRTRDILCVPMLAHERVVGVIEVINKKDGSSFNEEECSLLMSFGGQAAIAIENAQIFEATDQALNERVQELQALQMFDRELQASLELKTVLDISLTRAMDALGLEMGLMGVVKDQAGEEPGLYLLAQRGMPMEMSRYKKDPWPLTRGIIGRVVRTGEIAWVNDITLDKDYVPNSHKTRSVLVVPVLREEKVIGVIDLESTRLDAFTSDDVSFVKLLVSPAAIAIQNAQLFEQVKEVNQAKTDFMDRVSHDLKLPMTSIKGYAKLLQMTAGANLNEQQKEFLNVINNNVDRMARMVKDLLEFSRIEAGRIRLEIQDVQMREVIEEVIGSVRPQIENKQLNLKVEVEPNLPELRGDYNRIVEIMTNFVSNAYKYTPQGGDILVSAKASNNGKVNGVTVTVRDSGYGIAPEEQAKLFNEKFFRSNDPKVRDEPGTGLGLWITKNMIETHGGELTFESKLGQGSSFTFTLPLVCKIPAGVEVVER